MSETRPRGVPVVTAVNAIDPYVVTLENHRGHHWLGDEPAAAGGADKGPTPTELLLSSLGACTAITVRMYAAAKNWPLTGVEVKLELNPAGRASDGGNDIRRHLTLQGKLSAAQRERLLDVANKCPIHRLLAGELRIESSLVPP
jgi:putative redox protein